MPPDRRIAVHNGRDQKKGRTQIVTVERKGGKLPKRRTAAKPAPDDEKNTGLFVTGDASLADDNETWVLNLSRNPSADEKGIIFDALHQECKDFIRTKRWGTRCIRVRAKQCCGATLCGRRITETVREAVRTL